MKNKIDSKRFRHQLDLLGFSIPDLAKKLKMSSQLLNYKIGNKIRFNLDDIENITRVTNLSYDELFKDNITKNNC
jgi:transcriptional regulator with XRE-family HTH domain